MSLKYIQQNTTANKGLPYPSKSYPYVYGKSGCIYTSGCGVCTTLMVLVNSTTNAKTIKEWTNTMLKIGARVDSGTDMQTAAKHLVSEYEYEFKTVADYSDLKTHLKKGYPAIAHVGANNLFSSGGHYVFVSGIRNDDKKAIILDPYYYSNKFTSTPARKKAFTYNASTHELYVSFADLHSDTKGSKYYLFTPKKNVDLKYSAVSTIAAEIKAKKDKEKNKEVLLDYTVKNDVTQYFKKPISNPIYYLGYFQKGKVIKVVKGGRVTTINGIFFKVKYKGKYYYCPKNQLKKVK